MYHCLGQTPPTAPLYFSPEMRSDLSVLKAVWRISIWRSVPCSISAQESTGQSLCAWSEYREDCDPASFRPVLQCCPSTLPAGRWRTWVRCLQLEGWLCLPVPENTQLLDRKNERNTFLFTFFLILFFFFSSLFLSLHQGVHSVVHFTHKHTPLSCSIVPSFLGLYLPLIPLAWSSGLV